MFSNREIGTLSVLAMCRDTPAEIIPIIGEEDIDVLEFFGFIRISRNNISIRVTPEGHAILEKAGKDYPSDGQYRCDGAVLQRRLIVSRFIFWLKANGINSFIQKPALTNGISFLPSFALRREKGRNVLGASRFVGMLYGEKTAFACYYVTDDNDGIYPDAEQRTFSLEVLTCRKKSAVIFTGKDNYAELVYTSINSKSTASSAESYFNAAQRFTCDVCFIPMSDIGFRQFRILNIKNYKKRIFDAVLPNDWEALKGRTSDAVRKSTGEKYLVAIDGNISRLQSISGESTHVIMLSDHIKTAEKMLKGSKLILHPVDIREIERLLCDTDDFKYPPAPFITKEGRYLYAPVKAFGKSRR